MTRSLSVIRGGLLLTLLVSGGALLCLAGTVPGAPQVEAVYHSRIPLGTDLFKVDGWPSTLSVLVSASSPYFEGWRYERVGRQHLLLDAEGSRVSHFPSRIEFRVSVGTRTRLLDEPSFPLQTGLSVNDFLLKLRFEVKIFHELQQTVLAPRTVELIGVPADVPYDERIYSVRFDLPDIPVSDRVVLEVLAPDGTRLSKFPLDLF